MTWLTPRQAADRLGVSVKTIRNYRNNGLRYSKPSRKVVRIKEDWLDEFMESKERAVHDTALNQRISKIIEGMR